MVDLEKALTNVKARIAAAARRAGRDPSNVTLVAVTKTLPLECVRQAYQLGVCDFGENRIEEGQDKIPAFRAWAERAHTSSPDAASPVMPRPPAQVRFHMIGHLQSRKAREAIAVFDTVHSVDSLKLADKLSRLSLEAGRVTPVLLECNVSGEASKYGFQIGAGQSPSGDFLATVEAVLALTGLRLEGLMTMAPIVTDPQAARPVFAALRQLGAELSDRFGAGYFSQLSMGMTDDFEVAVEEGASMLRIGRALFGERGL